MAIQTVYTKNGYKNRRHYIRSIAEEYAVDEEFVFNLATVMGPNEDFDGLITEIQDYAEYVNHA